MEDKVRYPAIALMIAAGLSALIGILSLALNALSIGLGGLAGQSGTSDAQQQMMMSMFSGAFGAISAIVGLVIAGVIFFGAMKMYRFESYTFALVASALACLPCFNACCCIAIPIGIWSLITLQDQAVKDSFTS